jgi:hypothetical protein
MASSLDNKLDNTWRKNGIVQRVQNGRGARKRLLKAAGILDICCNDVDNPVQGMAN